jgi:hypothetical protein
MFGPVMLESATADIFSRPLRPGSHSKIYRKDYMRTVSFALVSALFISTTIFAATFAEDFSDMPTGVCYPDGSLTGPWQFVYNGYGCNGFLSSSGDTMLFERPKAATAPDETHAGLVVGPAVAGDFTLQLWTATTLQLRTGSAPNPWEVGWVLWNYTDSEHFYYFIAKPNGWELGKRDPAYPGGQRFLATGSAPSFPVGEWNQIEVNQSGSTMKVTANGVPITTFTDPERPYSSGRIGLYSEDAETYFDDVSVITGSRKGKKK